MTHKLTSLPSSPPAGLSCSLPSRTDDAALPPGLPLPAAAQTYLMWRSPFTYLERCRSRYGSRFTLRMTGFPPLVFISDPTEIQEVLAAPTDLLRPGEGASMTEPLVGESSFMLQDDDEHVFKRRMLLASFHGGRVRRHESMVAELAERAVASWPHDVPFPLHPSLRKLTLEIVLRKTFGQTSGISEEQLLELREALLEMLAITASAVLPLPMLRQSPPGRGVWLRFLRHRARVDDLIHALVGERRGQGVPGPDAEFIDLLLATATSDGSRLSPQQVRDNIMSVILAGHETTAAQLCWAFQLLAHHPKVRDRLVNEIEAGEGNEYMTATIQEVLRHRPVFLFAIPRAVTRPIAIGDRTYGPPAQLLSCIYLVHHDPTLYAEPEAFRPERFLSASPRPHLWLPWGGGHKHCPGRAMAVLEIETVLRAALSRLTVHPAAKEIERPRWRSVIVAPHAGSRVVLRSRLSRSVAD